MLVIDLISVYFTVSLICCVNGILIYLPVHGADNTTLLCSCSDISLHTGSRLGGARRGSPECTPPPPACDTAASPLGRGRGTCSLISGSSGQPFGAEAALAKTTAEPGGGAPRGNWQLLRGPGPPGSGAASGGVSLEQGL